MLRSYKKYIHPEKDIMWTVDKHLLQFRVRLKDNSRNASCIILPPTSLGICKDWCFERGEDNSIIFTAKWSLRRVKESLDKIDEINDKLYHYAITR